MSLQVNEFKYVPGENDAEYICLLKKALERQKQITAKAVAKIKELSKEQKIGKWLNTIQDGWWQCSNCGVYWQKTIVESCNIIYCPNCGAKMKGVDQNE